MNILIVDDEPGLAAGLAGWLKEIGWGSPGVATTSDEAIDWINRHGVDVLVCDVAIKPVDGFTLRETIQPHFPAMRTIFISGYDLSKYRARMAACQFLPKPVTGEALAEAIRRFFEPKEPRAVAVGSAASRARVYGCLTESYGFTARRPSCLAAHARKAKAQSRCPACSGAVEGFTSAGENSRCARLGSSISCRPSRGNDLGKLSG
jgi:two-component SAPR family response regulator